MTKNQHWWGDLNLPTGPHEKEITQRCKYCGLTRVIDKIEITEDDRMFLDIRAMVEVDCRKTYRVGYSGMMWPVVRF